MTDTCDRCGIVVAPGEWPWCPHGIPSMVVVSDTIIGGPRLFENLGSQPVYIESKSQLRDELKARNLQPMVRHVGVPGTDKSPHTQRFV